MTYVNGRYESTIGLKLKRKEETEMINEIVELGRAEDLVEIGLPTEPEEAVEKYESACAPYVEFE